MIIIPVRGNVVVNEKLADLENEWFMEFQMVSGLIFSVLSFIFIRFLIRKLSELKFC